ncbi:putative bifunctional diguanylate cyclase/phosphodiesterase [Actinokineospora enzanensis]|uniref:putative bifunctional diguanylate cyclase/phosphodiesterase n=1 Tax=Actinokineospora enzanensis TaxID=155975 RepID=UPI0012EB8FED|nr:EAL domain-containing protein [Actinokineospora enzanensis]
MRLPDGPGSRAVLIGAGRYEDPDLPDLPAVSANLAALAEILVSPAGTGLPAENCSVFSDPDDLTNLGVSIEAIAEQTRDTLLVYYSGHGVVDAQGRLCLAMPGTMRNRLRWTTLEFTRLRDVLLEAPAENRVLILDCCFSGRAIEAMASAESVMSGQIEIAGTYTLASAPANAAANAPMGEPLTAFTGELVRVLRDGLPGGPPLLSFTALYPHLVRALDARGLARPVQRGVRTADQLALAPNRAHAQNRLLTRDAFLRQDADLVTGSAAVIRVELTGHRTHQAVLGYGESERMLTEAAHRLVETVGPDAPVARLEGPSFAALLVGPAAQEVDALAERVHTELSRPYTVAELAVHVGVLVGHSAGDRPVETLLHQADLALQAAWGPHPVRDYQPTIGDVFLRRYQIASRFRRGIATGQVHVRYQPRIAPASRRLVGVEALVRWRHPELGSLDPNELVPTVESTGQADELTDFVLYSALGRARAWSNDGLDLSMSVNISPRNLDDQGFPDRVAALLADHAVPPGSVTLALTESALAVDPERAMSALWRLRETGVRIALDNFGSAQSSLSYLRQSPVDEVTIDRQFVGDLLDDRSDRTVVRSLVDIAHSLGLTACAIGVEEATTLNALTAMGCDIVQGYLISGARSGKRLAAWIATHTTRSADSAFTWRP